MSAFAELGPHRHGTLSQLLHPNHFDRFAGEIVWRLKRRVGESSREAKKRAGRMRWFREDLQFDSRDRKYWVWRKRVI